MPYERVSKPFKDISLSFKINPLNFDLIDLKNERAIARSIQNLVLTNRGERFFNQDIGCNIENYLFEQFDAINANFIQGEIERVIRTYERRVNLLNVSVTSNQNEDSFDVTIAYEIVGVDALPQQLSFALQKTR